jgi:excisionase family DNA binding protein
MTKNEKQPSLVMSVEEFAQAMQISRTFAYQLCRENKAPVPVIRLGRRMVLSRKAVDQVLASGNATESQNER